MKPGTLPWLLRFEVLLYWRNLFSSSQKWAIVVLGVLLLGAVTGLWFLLRGYSDVLQSSPAVLPEPLLLPLTALGAFVAAMMGATAIQSSVQVMFERGDLDLLVSSPVSTRNIFAVRVLGVVLAVSLWWMLLGLVLALLGLLLGTWRLLGVPLGFLTLGMVVSALGVALTFLLVRRLGVRRTRTIIQVLTFVFGGLLFMASQLPNLLGRQMDSTFGPRLMEWVETVKETFPAVSPLWHWARSLWLEPLPTLLTVMVGMLVLAVVITSSHTAYLRGASEASGFNRPRQVHLKTVPFRSSVFSLMWTKEWRLVLRDPALVSQLIMQVIYLLPMVFVLFGMGRDPGRINFMNPSLWVAMTVLVASSLTSWISRVFVAAEDLPDLLAMSPHPAGSLRRQKMWITLLPILVVFVPLAVLLGRSDPVLMVLGALLVPTSALMVARMQTQWGQPIKRADLLRKDGKGQGNALHGFIELFTYVGWAGVIAAYGQNNTLWMGIALAAGVFFPLVFTVINWRKPSPLGY